MPAAWTKWAATQPASQPSITVQAEVEVEQWWTAFGDPELDSLINRAVASNYDLQLAFERIRAARATIRIARADLFPQANLNGAYSRAGTGRIGGQDLWRSGVDSSWELDVFGGVRRTVEAATANAEATVEDRRDILVTLFGEVATDYILLRGSQQQIAIARQNLQVQERNVELTRQKKRIGSGTDLDIVQAASQVADTKAEIVSLQVTQQQTVYALSVLLALPPATLCDELAPPAQIPAPPNVVPIGIPADLLRRRPDIRVAERELAAATAQIGVAVADLYPRFSLSGSIGLEASSFGGLGNWNNGSWSIGPSFAWPIFDAGRIRANIAVQNSAATQALINYRKTVLLALQEVEGALVAYSGEQRRRESLADSVSLNLRAVELATKRYNQGQTDFLAVLDAERSLFGSQNALVLSDRDVATNAVVLYKALGGGWAPFEPPGH